MDLQLSGKTAIVTGGSRGICRAIATALAAEGVDVGVLSRTASTLEEAAAETALATGPRAVRLIAESYEPGATEGPGTAGGA